MSCQILFYRESEEKKINKKQICHLLIYCYKRFKSYQKQQQQKKKKKKKKKKNPKKQYITNAISKKGIHDISCLTTLSIDLLMFMRFGKKCSLVRHANEVLQINLIEHDGPKREALTLKLPITTIVVCFIICL